MSIKDWLGHLRMNELDDIIQKALDKNLNEDVFSVRYNNKKLWVKKARPTGSRFFHKFVYTLYKHPLIIPVDTKDSQEAAAHESSKIQHLHDLGISVPKVIQTGPDYFVLEDRGPTVNDLMHKDLLNDPMEVFEKIISALAKLHNLKEFHGSSQIKNFTYKKGEVSFIDFEESFTEQVEIEELQFRDLFLFLLSLSRLDREFNYEKLLRSYIALTKKEEIIDKFHSLIKKVSLLMKLIQNRTVWKFLDNDTKGIYKLLLQIKEIKT